MFDKQKFKACIILSGLSVKQISSKLSINPATFYRKINRNGDFNRNEIKVLKEILAISNPDEIFFTD